MKTQRRYLAVALLLIVVMAFHVRHGSWGGDFWEHAAVLRELIAHPLAPQHPRMQLATPSAFFSPYAIGAAVLARVTHSDPVSTLTNLAVVNLALFVIGLYWLARSVFPEASESQAPFYFLLLVLFFWGQDPWGWSGFFHLAALVSWVLPYPSTFAGALTFLGLAAERRRLENGDPRLLVVAWLTATLVLLCHPPTAVALLILLAAFHLGEWAAHGPRRSIEIAIAMLLAFGAAAAWPYFPFISLLGNHKLLDVDGAPFYTDVGPRVWPFAVCLPLVWARMRRDRTDPLVAAFVMLAAVYVSAGLARAWGIGRLISFIGIVLQLILAGWLSRLEAGWATATLRMRATLVLSLVLVASRVGATALVVKEEWHRQRPNATQYAFLSRFVSPTDVILSDLETSWVTPAFAGRVVASFHVTHWVDDNDARRRDVNRFFERSTSHAERLAIIDRYHVRFILLDDDQSVFDGETKGTMRRYGRAVFEDGHRTLIQLHDSLE